MRVPVENLIGGENQGFIGIMLNFNSERLGMAASANGSARVCLDEAMDWAQQAPHLRQAASPTKSSATSSPTWRAA